MNGIMSSWVDADISEVVAQWGEPDEVREADGQKIYVWDHPANVTPPKVTVRSMGVYVHTSPPVTAPASGEAGEANCRRLLILSAQGKVVNWQWDGDGCPRREDGPYADWRRKNAEP